MEQATFQHTLPSGKQITMRYVDLIELAENGDIPDPLTGIVEWMIAKRVQVFNMANAAERARLDEQQDGQHAADIIRFVVCASSVDPKLYDTLAEVRAARKSGEQNAHYIGKYSQDDILSMFHAAQGVAGRLAAMFHDGGAAERQDDQGDHAESGADAVELVSDGEGEQPVTEPTAESAA